MTPWYLKKKFWVALVTAGAYGAGSALGDQEVANSILYVGLALIGALGLEDFGKASK
jgi:hypothetical protein